MSASYVGDLRDAITRYLPRRGMPLIVADNKKLRWTPRLLVVQALLMSFAVGDSLASCFHQALSTLIEMYPSRRRPGGDCGGFLRHLARDGHELLKIIGPHLRRHVQRLAGKRHWLVGGWNCFGVDGSKDECPMTEANEEAFGIAGRNKSTPQQLLTTLFHVGTGMIWDFVRGRGIDSERRHLLEMLCTLPPACLLLADAGFTGYDFFREILLGGRHLLVRVGSNVKLLTGLGWCVQEDRRRGLVYLWPDKAQKRGQEPLTLRLITLADGRNRRIHLLTDVLDEMLLGDEQAGEIYRRRWGVELIFRSLKQTMGKRKLRCDCPAHAAAELDWSVMALWLLGLLTLERTLEAGHEPGRWSAAAALRVVRAAMQKRPPTRRRPAFALRLAEAVKDSYTRTTSKRARHWPHKKRDKCPGDPRARRADEQEVQLARELREKKQAA